MTDQPDQPEGDVPGFDDPAYDDVRALLADARVTDPVPEDVAVRLDATLTALQAERAGSPGAEAAAGAPPAPVVPLRRRSRVAPRVLVAAAAVVVLGASGVGMTQVLRGDADQGVTVSADAGAESPELAPAVPTPSDLDTQNEERGDASFRVSLPQFTADGFAAEAAAFQARYDTVASRLIRDEAQLKTAPSAEASPGTGAEPSSGTPTPPGVTAYSSKNQELLSALSAAKEVCPGPIDSDAARFAIQYDGLPTTLAIYPAASDGQRFEVWSCDGQTLIASTVVPAP